MDAPTWSPSPSHASLQRALRCGLGLVLLVSRQADHGCCKSGEADPPQLNLPASCQRQLPGAQWAWSRTSNQCGEFGVGSGFGESDEVRRLCVRRFLVNAAGPSAGQPTTKSKATLNCQVRVCLWLQLVQLGSSVHERLPEKCPFLGSLVHERLPEKCPFLWKPFVNRQAFLFNKFN